MSLFFIAVSVAIGALIAVNVHRVVYGPTVYDRLLALNVVGVNAVLLLALLGVIFDRLETFIDLAIVYALLSFIGLIAVAKYLEPPRGPTR